MDLEAARRLYDMRHEDRPYHDGSFPKNPLLWATEPSRSTPYHYLDGVSIYLAEYDENPEDKFLG